ncbi:MAG: hypothetical protein FWG51_01065 [Firmicutes bacterium]|nr:hypothetical protein [Bacillota bacterium]
MSKKNEELKTILKKFAELNWELINKPSKAWIEGKNNTEELLIVLKKAEEECGSCGCEFDPLYKRAYELLGGR